jgi:hypothetical protein
MNDEQYKRFKSMENNDTIKCLYSVKDSKDNMYFLVSGSNGNKYKVVIKTNGKIICSCPDFSNGSKIQECVCKHCLCVIYKYLHLFRGIEHTFFKRKEKYFTPDEITIIKKIFKEKCNSNIK